jgi:hypothetical protein
MSVLVITLSTLFSNAGYSDAREDSIRQNLLKFDADPAAFMNQTPEKSVNGRSIPSVPSNDTWSSSYERINSEMDSLDAKRAASHPVQRHLEVKIPVHTSDTAENLVDTLKYTTLESMEAAQLTDSHLGFQPWSGTYWPIARGIISWRYSDPSSPKSSDWKKNADYTLSETNSCTIDQLSPAEKYDLLVGDEQQTLTHKMWEEGQYYYETYGKVESWMGICHGWAPASFMVSRPTKGVTVLAKDGHTQIPFSPTDLKALDSLLWAKGDFDNRLIGERCDTKKPTKDKNGRIMDPTCYGENPGTWHLAVVNQIGVAHRSFVMNAPRDIQVWNQPVYGYHYTYFNPQTKAPVATLAEASIPIESFTHDKFKKYRSPSAQSIAGIAMDLTYVAESGPSQEATDSPENDNLVTIHYLYDVEIGADGAIIGGEWYSHAHPGFLWTPTPNAHAISAGDSELIRDGIGISWETSKSIPSEWSVAIRSSSTKGQPLAKIVEGLNEMLRQE